MSKLLGQSKPEEEGSFRAPLLLVQLRCRSSTNASLVLPRGRLVYEATVKELVARNRDDDGGRRQAAEVNLERQEAPHKRWQQEVITLAMARL